MNSDSDSDVDRGIGEDSLEENSVASDFDGNFALDDLDDYVYDDSFEVSSVESYEDPCIRDFERIKYNDPVLKKLSGVMYACRDFTDQEWEELGLDISNNTHLKKISFSFNNLNDHNALLFFSGLRRSCSIEEVDFDDNELLSVVGVRSMVPFLQNAGNLRELSLSQNNIRSEGFNIMFRALRDSPIETLYSYDCGIESIEIDELSIPRRLDRLFLSHNSINADGCRELAKLLKGEYSTLAELSLHDNKIDDDGVAFLVDALWNNTSLKTLQLYYNDDISHKGLLKILKLVNDTSCVKSTLQSNHTLTSIFRDDSEFFEQFEDESDLLQFFGMFLYERLISEITGYMIKKALAINKIHDGNAETAGKEKLIQQLRRDNKSILGKLQGVNRTLYSEIDPLHLPEVLSLVGRRHGQDELYVAFKSSIADVISIVNRREYIRQKRDQFIQKRDHYAALVEKLNAELAAIDASAR